jgi:hypothetical protein
MNYLYEALDKPTRLYIKQCPHCGLKYFGKHTGQNIEGYPGSGTFWTKHLNENNVEPIHLWNSGWYYDTSIKRFALKFSSINKIVESNEWANLIPEDGLRGGWDLINKTGRNLYGYNGRTPNVPDNFRRGLETFRKNLKNPEWREKNSKKISIGVRKWQSENGNPFLGKTHSDETKEKIGSLSSIHQSGAGNSQYGTMWITDGSISKKIKNTDNVPLGWYKGRVITTTSALKTVKPPIFKHIRTCVDCIKNKNKENAYFWYDNLKESNAKSISEFVRNSDYNKSVISFIKMLKKYIPNFNPKELNSH